MELLRLAKHYTEGMIFQRDKNILIEGEALVPCEITAIIGDDIAAIKTEIGYFSLTLPPRKADCGLVLTIKACTYDKEQIIELNEIYIGEVWFACGQSNMQWYLNDTDEYRQNPVINVNTDIRLYTVGRNVLPSQEQLDDDYKWAYCNDHGWVGCDEEGATHFSAVGYHFAHTLYEAIGVPIGIINCNVGGSSIYSWIPATSSDDETAAAKAEYNIFLDEIKKHHDISTNISGLGNELPVVYFDKTGPYHFHNPGILYKSMLERVSSFPARGMLWYQGETEAGHIRAKQYAAALETLVENMKNRQDDPDFAFSCVQITPYGDEAPYWATVNDQMRRFFLAHPDYSVVTTGDVGCATDIHPQRKRPVGERLAYAAMHRCYDYPHEFTGPIAESAIRLGDEIRISFIHGAGLHKRPMDPGRFELVYNDGTIKEATPEIRDNAVYLPIPEGVTPESVRYEFVTYAQIGLYNKYGYPASLFELQVM